MKVKRKLHVTIILVLFGISLVFGVADTVDARTGPEVHTNDIHALLIFSNDDRQTFSVAIDKNERCIENLLLPLGVKPDVMKANLDKRKYYAEDVIDWIENKNVKAEDTIFVYYYGDGYMNLDNKHYLAISGRNLAGGLPRSTLIEALSKKNCRLRMLITDTSSVGGQQLKSPTTIQITRVRPQKANTTEEGKKSHLGDLFYKHKGLLDITAASPGQDSWSNNNIGGIFTYALSTSIGSDADKDKDGFVSWQEAFELAQFKTNVHFREIDIAGRKDREGNLSTQTRQTPFKFSLPTPTVTK